MSRSTPLAGERERAAEMMRMAEPKSQDALAAEHERGLVRAFVSDAKQERYLELLAKPKKRSGALHEFAGRRHLDSRFMREIRPSEQTVARIAELLRDRGAPRDCYAVSELDKVDGRMAPLEEALTAIVGMGLGALLSCIPGRLAYYEGEMPGDRCILYRPTGPARGFTSVAE
jgi:hypothetical protein